jgi:hypothetical protein
MVRSMLAVSLPIIGWCLACAAISSRYTDVYVRQHGEWKAAAAQITRVPQSRSTS